jgi:hypothetical protein
MLGTAADTSTVTPKSEAMIAKTSRCTSTFLLVFFMMSPLRKYSPRLAPVSRKSANLMRISRRSLLDASKMGVLITKT